MTNPLGHKVTTQYDPGCGKKLWESVLYTGTSAPPAPRRTEIQYDNFCRQEKIWRPGESTTGAPYRRMVYKLGAPYEGATPAKPTTVATYAREPNHLTGEVVTSVLYDALGRMLQQKSEAVIDGSLRFVANGTTEYDERGNVGMQYVPVNLGISKNLKAFSAPPGGTGATTFLYDALGRASRATKSGWELTRPPTTQPLGRRRAWMSATMRPAAWAGTWSRSRTHSGERSRGGSYQETSTFKSCTKYDDYDELRRLTKTTQGSSATSLNANTEIRVTCDSLGRKIEMTDPDSGLWKYGYDRVGNLIFQDDPKADQYIRFCYDSLNRITKKQYVPWNFTPPLTSCTFNYDEQITYSYDQAIEGLGRPYEVADLSGLTRHVSCT